MLQALLVSMPTALVGYKLRHLMISLLSSENNNDMTPFSKTAFVLQASLSMAVKSSHKKSRPVFLSAALARMLRQPWRNRPRTTAVIASFVLREAAWWLTNGVWHVPRTLRIANRRKLLLIRPPNSEPAFDVYSHSSHQPYVDSCIRSSQGKGQPSSESNPLVIVYVHGGAWGSGQAAHYSQLAANIADSSEAVVLVLSYRLYPVATISEQVDDVTAALRHARATFQLSTLVLLGHSSGANIATLALLHNAVKQDHTRLADVAILTAGPYHLMHHFLFESRRGVAEISPMLPAADAESDHTRFDDCSPSVIAEKLDIQLTEPRLPASPTALEGDLPASNVPMPEADVSDTGASFPRTYVLTSSCDKIVPMYSSLRFVAALRRVGLAARLLVYDGTAHVDFVVDWFEKAKSRDLSDLLDVGKKDRSRRIACVNSLVGQEHSKLTSSEEQLIGVSPYVRDVLRILKSLKPPSDSGNQISNGFSVHVTDV